MISRHFTFQKCCVQLLPHPILTMLASLDNTVMMVPLLLFYYRLFFFLLLRFIFYIIINHQLRIIYNKYIYNNNNKIKIIIIIYNFIIIFVCFVCMEEDRLPQTSIEKILLLRLTEISTTGQFPTGRHDSPFIARFQTLGAGPLSAFTMLLFLALQLLLFA